MKRLFAVAFAFLLVGCAGATKAGTRPPRTLPAGAVHGLHSRARSLDAAELAADAGSEALGDVLGDAGYVVGSEREFFGRTTTFNHIVARVLLFKDSQGALRLLAWLRSHPDVVLGSAVEGKPPALGESPMLFSLGACGCHSEVPAFLVAWGRGDSVLWLLAAGPGATRAAVDSLARNFDRLAG